MNKIDKVEKFSDEKKSISRRWIWFLNGGYLEDEINNCWKNGLKKLINWLWKMYVVLVVHPYIRQLIQYKNTIFWLIILTKFE